MHILITGHTGFKGSWLSLLLKSLGHKVSGISLDPEPESHFILSKIENYLVNDVREDIRDKTALNKVLIQINPEFIFHLAAQPLVKEGYRDPEYTYEVNVNGTLNVLQSAQKTSNIKGVLVITSDKVYANSKENKKPFSESDSLGSGDPYSTSKAMADLLAQSWIENSKGPTVGIARAGNVIGGGDFSVDRLIPDLVRNTKRNQETLIRYPKAVRPWQHVLDCLNGYVKQMDFILEGNKAILNFGPDFGQYFEVEEVANKFLEFLGTGSWKLDRDPHPYEANFLTLDSRKAAKELNWSNKYNFQKSLNVTASWYRDYLDGKDLANSSKNQVQDYLKQ
jgi:CDP-glucose 4,6-dehydratase